MRINRQSIVIWYQHRKNIKKIKRHGNLIYASKRMKYAILYVEQEAIEDISQKLLSYPFISKVELSQRPFIETNYDTTKSEYDIEV